MTPLRSQPFALEAVEAVGAVRRFAGVLLVGTVRDRIVAALCSVSPGPSTLHALLAARERFPFPSLEWSALHALLLTHAAELERRPTDPSPHDADDRKDPTP
jgi:hypothetical protein